MRFVNQRDYPDVMFRTHTDDPEDPVGLRTTVKSSACALCSSIMVLDRLMTDYQFDVKDALELCYACGANHGSGADGVIYFPAFADRFGLRYEISNSFERVSECLRTGGAVIVLVANREEEGYVSVFTRGGHYITVIGETADGRFEVLDPDLYEGKYEEPDRKGRVELFGKVALVSQETMKEETKKVVRRSEGTKLTKAYHLFWRGYPSEKEEA